MGLLCLSDLHSLQRGLAWLDLRRWFAHQMHDNLKPIVWFAHCMHDTSNPLEWLSGSASQHDKHHASTPTNDCGFNGCRSVTIPQGRLTPGHSSRVITNQGHSMNCPQTQSISQIFSICAHLGCPQSMFSLQQCHHPQQHHASPHRQPPSAGTRNVHCKSPPQKKILSPHSVL